MRATRSSRSAALPAVLAATLVTLLAAGAAVAGSLPAAGQTAPGTSGQGIVPTVLNGGNMTCADVPSSTTLQSSERLEVQGNSLRGDLPTGLDVTLASNKRSINWTSTFPMTAVIVKGGDVANVYVYAPPSTGDTGLTAPPRPNGQPADVSNVTFCWSTGGNGGGNGVDLQAHCLAEAEKADVGDIVSFAGPIVIEDGAVIASSVPADVVADFDPMTEQVSFTAPFEVVVAITAASTPGVHRIDPPSASGSVPLSSNPGDGELVLCGLDTSVVVTVSCARTGADAELGPIPVRGATFDPEDVPTQITSLDLTASIAFTSTVPVVGIIVEASPPVLYAFATPVLSGSIPVTVLPEDDLDLVFCVRTVSTSGGSSSSSATDTPADAPVGAAADPTEIATGGGPSGRTLFALVSFLILAVTGSSTLLLSSRGG